MSRQRMLLALAAAALLGAPGVSLTAVAEGEGEAPAPRPKRPEPKQFPQHRNAPAAPCRRAPSKAEGSMNQQAHDLFSYPQQAGYKRRDTSRAAAERIPAQLLRGKVLAEFQRQKYMTADECAQALGLSVLSIRPRVTELSNMHKIMDSGSRRPNASGRSAIVWVLVP